MKCWTIPRSLIYEFVIGVTEKREEEGGSHKTFSNLLGKKHLIKVFQIWLKPLQIQKFQRILSTFLENKITEKAYDIEFLKNKTM